VRVLCSEGIANHTGPESCVVHREMQGEALTGSAFVRAELSTGGGMYEPLADENSWKTLIQS
jgi:hypothetical protein